MPAWNERAGRRCRATATRPWARANGQVWVNKDTKVYHCQGDKWDRGRSEGLIRILRAPSRRLKMPAAAPGRSRSGVPQVAHGHSRHQGPAWRFMMGVGIAFLKSRYDRPLPESA